MFTSVRRLVDRVDIRVVQALLAVSVFWLLACLLFYRQCILHVLPAAILLYGAWSALLRKQAGHELPGGKAVLITGCDTGFGFDLALHLDELGFTVLASCLRPEGAGAKQLKSRGSPNLEVLGLDVSSDDSVAQCLEIVEMRCRNTGLWAVVNNAGINVLGDTELTTMAQYQRVAEVNLFGMVRVTKACLPLIRKARGRVINTTSVKGRLALPSNAAYCVSKFGAEAFSDMLRLEMYRFGIKVIIIEPGNFGGATGCLNEEGMARIRGDLDVMAEQATPEVRELYGLPAYLQQQFQDAGASAATTYPSTRPVLDAYVEALLSLRPQDRYLIDGSNSLLDKYCVLARLRNFLPDPWMDFLVHFYFGLPPLPRPKSA